MLSLARFPLTYLARLAVGLCIFSGTAAAGEFCALSVSISTHDGRPARLTPVLLMDSSGKRVFDEQADGSELRICDFGFGPHKLVIGYGFCYPVTIVLKGKPSVITFSRTGYSALQLSLTCPSAEEIDREIVLTPDER